MYRTPLRYPGGKQRLAPFIRELLICNNLIGGDYAEPYAGGAGVAFELLLDGQVERVHLNDSSWPIYAFWRSVLFHTEALCRKIKNAVLDVQEWKKQRQVIREPEDHDELEVGFSVLYLNRCNRSGVLTGGLIGGLEQTGKWLMDARFPREDLIRRIESIAAKRDAVSLTNLDAEEYILEYVPALPENSLVYCDPPYFAQRGRLYLNQYRTNDHARIAQIIQERLVRKWVVSYDSAPEILGYYRDRRAFEYHLQYSASRAYRGREVFIFCDELKIPEGSSVPFVDKAIKEWRVSLSTLASSVETS